MLLLLALVHTYPLVTGLHHLSRYNDDEWLNAWAVSWIAHQLPRDPLAIFDANMYYPFEQTLAYTEPLLIPGVMGAPVFWLSGSPMLTYNVLLLAGMTLTGLATYALVVRWTGDSWSGVAAGALLVFGTPMLTRLPHLQIHHFYWLPLALIAFDDLVTTGRSRAAAACGLCVVGAALTSGYTAIFLAVALGAALVARLPDLWSRDGVRSLARLGAVAGVTLATLLVLLRPYVELQLVRPLPAASDVLTTVQMYLSSATQLHYRTWGQGFFERAPASFFPGVVALGLAGFALWSWRGLPTAPRRMLAAIGAAGFVLSFGQLTPVYAAVYRLLPPVQSMRAPDRFAILAFLAVVILAGLGLAALLRRVPPARRGVVAGALLVLATVEGIHGPIQYRPVDWEHPIHRPLADVEEGPIVHFPLHSDAGFNRNSFYLLGSTAHWRPIMNGYGNSSPSEYDETAAVVSRFPWQPAVARLRALGVRHVIVHGESAPQVLGRLARTTGRSDLALVAQLGSDRLYRINDPADTPLDAVLQTVPWADMMYVQQPSRLSYIGAFDEVGPIFGVQHRARVVFHVEDTTAGSTISLALPATMTGAVYDGVTGQRLHAITVARAGGIGTTVDLPPDRDAIVLDLYADD